MKLHAGNLEQGLQEPPTFVVRSNLRDEKDRIPLTWPAVWEAMGMSLAGIGIAGIILVIVIFIVT